jgi:hypothetical protein
MSGMTGHDIESRTDEDRRIWDRIVDWLGAQGPLLLTVYMCAIVALIAYVSGPAR